MAEVKLTKRDKFNLVVEVLENGVNEDTDVEMLVDFVKNEVALLDKKSAKAKESAGKHKADTDELSDKVKAVLTDEYLTIAEVTNALEDADATPAKVAYRLNALVTLGVAKKEEKTISGGEGVKSRKVQSYALA